VLVELGVCPEDGKVRESSPVGQGLQVRSHHHCYRHRPAIVGGGEGVEQPKREIQVLVAIDRPRAARGERGTGGGAAARRRRGHAHRTRHARYLRARRVRRCRE
jgi:hypothetical protein